MEIQSSYQDFPVLFSHPRFITIAVEKLVLHSSDYISSRNIKKKSDMKSGAEDLHGRLITNLRKAKPHRVRVSIAMPVEQETYENIIPGLSQFIDETIFFLSVLNQLN